MKLVTVAVYNLPTQAQIARNSLEAAGIKAYVADAELVAMDLVLSSAVGGVKVQVSDADAQHAADVLTDIYGNAAGVTTENVDEEELTRQALEAAPDDHEELPEEAHSPPPQVDAATAGAADGDDREHYAHRYVRAAVFSYIIPFLCFYAIYLLLNTLFSAGKLSGRGMLNLVMGSVLLLVFFAILASVLNYYGVTGLTWTFW